MHAHALPVEPLLSVALNLRPLSGSSDLCRIMRGWHSNWASTVRNASVSAHRTCSIAASNVLLLLLLLLLDVFAAAVSVVSCVIAAVVASDHVELFSSASRRCCATKALLKPPPVDQPRQHRISRLTLSN